MDTRFIDTLMLDSYGYFIVFYPVEKDKSFACMAQSAFLPIEKCRELASKKNKENIMDELLDAKKEHWLKQKEVDYLNEYIDELEAFAVRL